MGRCSALDVLYMTLTRLSNTPEQFWVLSIFLKVIDSLAKNAISLHVTRSTSKRNTCKRILMDISSGEMWEFLLLPLPTPGLRGSRRLSLV